MSTGDPLVHPLLCVQCGGDVQVHLPPGSPLPFVRWCNNCNATSSFVTLRVYLQSLEPLLCTRCGYLGVYCRPHYIIRTCRYCQNTELQSLGTMMQEVRQLLLATRELTKDAPT